MRITFENTDLLSMREAARLLGITTMTLHRWCVKGKIQAVKVGAYRAIHKDEIKRLGTKSKKSPLDKKRTEQKIIE